MSNASQISSIGESELPPIKQRYLLITLIPCYRDAQGERYLDALWYKDLVKHLDYLECFALAAPCLEEAPPPQAMPVSAHPLLSKISFVDLPAPQSGLQAVSLLPITVQKLWQAISQAEIVHTGVAGWPIPPGWLVTPIVLLQQKIYVIIVESAFWRLSPGAAKPLKARFLSWLSEHLNRWCINNTNLAIFTQDDYRQSLLTRHPERGHVIHASWIDEENVLSETIALEDWQKKTTSPTPTLNLLFAGRLIPDKGVLVLLEAIQKLGAEAIPVSLDILGEGPLLETCEITSKSLPAPTKIQVLGTVAYGSEFFQLLRNYDAVIVPGISDEQPRIVYDAYSQAIPVLASNTAGLRDCIQNGETGMLVAPGDGEALADLLKWAVDHLPELSRMGIASLKAAQSMTHREMHRRRWKLLLNTLDQPTTVK